MIREWISVVEALQTTYTDVEFVCINPSTGGSDPARVRALYDALSKMPGLLLVRQDYMEEAGHLVLRAIILDPAVHVEQISDAADQAGVEIDVVSDLPARAAQDILDEMISGHYENQIDALNTTTGYHVRGVCWSPENERWEGHLVEVVETDVPLNDSIEQFTKEFDQSKDVLVWGSVTGRRADHDGISYFGLFDAGRHVALLTIVPGPQYPMIDTILVAHDKQGEGYGRAILKWYVETSGPVTCSPEHTTAARRMWMALMRSPGHIQISMLDLATGTQTEFPRRHSSYVADPDPWSLGQNVVLLIQDAKSTFLPEGLRRICPYGLGKARRFNP